MTRQSGSRCDARISASSLRSKALLERSFGAITVAAAISALKERAPIGLRRRRQQVELASRANGHKDEPFCR